MSKTMMVVEQNKMALITIVTSILERHGLVVLEQQMAQLVNLI
jgi:hypothetical protein